MQEYNITSATTTTLRSLSTRLTGNIKSIGLTYSHLTTALEVKLFLEDSSSERFFICRTTIPGGVTLFVDQGLSYNTELFALKIQTSTGGLSTSTPLSVIIK